MSDLTGKVVLVTGAKGGLGSFVTEGLLRAGATVIGVSRSIQQSDFAQQRFHAIPAELTNAEAARKLVADALGQFQAVDALVHVMGAFGGGQRVDETEDALMDRMFDLNFRSAFYMMSAVLPHMRERGRGSISVVASRQGVEPGAMVGAYSASKAAVVALVKTVALENKDRGISANTVLPGTMDTPANRDGDRSKFVQPLQVAAVLIHLVSDEGSQITGAAIPVYGLQL